MFYDTISPPSTVPMILFFSQLLSHTLPKQLVEEEMVINYLRCLNAMTDCDGSTQESVRYAVYSMSEVLEHLQQKSVSGAGGGGASALQNSISDTKTWLCQLQAATTIDTL